MAGELDPGKNESTLGKALNHVKDLLNPALASSVQQSINSAIASVTGEKDGAGHCCKGGHSTQLSHSKQRWTHWPKKYVARKLLKKRLCKPPRKGAPKNK